MKKTLKYSLLTLGLALAASSVAHADSFNRREPWHDPPQRGQAPERRLAPEVDPSLAISGFALLGGTLTVLRSRRRK
jgi:LPXTG-motif cell wall-anchored protein